MSAGNGTPIFLGEQRLIDVETCHANISPTGGIGFGQTTRLGYVYLYKTGSDLPNIQTLPNIPPSILASGKTAYLRTVAANGTFLQATTLAMLPLGSNPPALLEVDIEVDIKVFKNQLEGELIYHETREYGDAPIFKYWITPNGWLPQGAVRRSRSDVT